MSSVRKRKSKLEPFSGQLGKRPDGEIAELAGVRSETVRSYRIRHGIPALWKKSLGVAVATDQENSSEGGPETDSAGTRPRKVGKPARKRAFRGRRSRIDPYRALLGQLSDREIAQKAGVTTENVRAYRNRRAIPAQVNGGEARVPTTGPVVRSQRPVLAVTQRWAYRVRVKTDSGSREYVVVGGSMGEAARIAEDRLGEILPGSVLVELAVVGEAL